MKYKITIVLETDNGNPLKWDWNELLDEQGIETLSVKQVNND
jgi:hypothetical protein